MGAFEKLFTLAFLLVVGSLILALGAVGTGFVFVDDPLVAVSQMVSGNLEDPEVGVTNGSFKATGVEDEYLEMEAKIYVDNEPNDIGGWAHTISYDVYWSRTRTGRYYHLAEGRLANIKVLPHSRVQKRTSMRITSEDSPNLANATSFYLENGEIYLKMKGNTSVRFGLSSYRIPFEEKKKVEIERAVVR